MDLIARLTRAEALSSSVQSNVDAAEWDANERRVAAACQASHVAGSALLRVPANYYSLPLVERAQLLDCAPTRLCKSIILENASGTVVGDTRQPLGLQKYLCVIVQYLTKLDLNTLVKQVQGHSSNAGQAVPPVKLAMCEGADKLTGYGYNAMTPFGSLTPMAVIVARPIMKLPAPSYIFLGGGREDTKLRVFTAQLTREGVLGVAGYAAAVLDCVMDRDDGDEQD